MKPRKCIIENEIEFEGSIFINQKICDKKIYSLNCLKKEEEKIFNFKYDLVIRIRPDLYIIYDNIF